MSFYFFNTLIDSFLGNTNLNMFPLPTLITMSFSGTKNISYIFSPFILTAPCLINLLTSLLDSGL